MNPAAAEWKHAQLSETGAKAAECCLSGLQPLPPFSPVNFSPSFTEISLSCDTEHRECHVTPDNVNVM